MTRASTVQAAPRLFGERIHRLLAFWPLVVVAQQMEDAVDGQDGQLGGCGMALVGGLFC